MTRRDGAIARRTLVAAAIALLLLGVAATAPERPATHMIVIDRMKFGPVPKDLHAGDTVIWVNRDLFRHTATARDGRFNIDLLPGKSAKMVLGKPGTVAFYCTFHPGMRGQLVILG